MAPTTSTRRSFLRAAAAAVPALALPACRSAGRPQRAPGDKLRLGVIGVRGRGGDNLGGVKGEEIAALCDVDRNHLAEAARQFPGAKTFADLRELLREPGLDAVVISTPDHVHYPAAAMALQQGLDVYCEKPLTHTVMQARRLQRLAAEHGCVTQMGTQIHANDNYRRVVEAVQAGAIGEVKEVHVFVGRGWSAKGRPPKAEVPPTLDWDLWLGPVAGEDYTNDYHPANWRKYWRFGGGTTADMACHHMDLPFWALSLRAPSQVRADGSEPDEYGAPAALTAEYWFERAGKEPLRLQWWAGDVRPKAQLAERGIEWGDGVLFIGEHGWLVSDYDRHQLGPKDKFAAWSPPAPSIPKSIGHHAEWIAACKARTQPTCWFGYAGPLTEAALLANVCYRRARGHLVTWDADRLQILGANAANELLDEPLRDGWRA